MSTKQKTIDPLKLDPRAISVLIAVARFPNGVTINKLYSLLAMSYRTIRALCDDLTSQSPPLLIARSGAYTEYSLHPSTNLPLLLNLEPPAIQPTRHPDHPEPQPRPPKRTQSKRANLDLETLRVKKVSLDLDCSLVLLENLKGIDSLSLTTSKTLQAKTKDKAQSYKIEDLRAFKNIRVKHILVDELTAPLPSNQTGERTTQNIRLPQDDMVQASVAPDEQPTTSTARPNEPATRKYRPPDTRRMLITPLPEDLFQLPYYINGRQWNINDINPRHNQQYLFHTAKLFDNPVLWNSRFNGLKEGLVLGWIAQALDGYDRGRVLQPWGIIYRGLLGELPNRYPDKRFRDEPHKILPRDWLFRAGFHLEESDLPPTPEQDPDWEPEEE